MSSGFPADTAASELARIQRAVAGDQVALTLQLKQTRARLREQIALRIPADLRSVLDADDVVQEAHVEVFQHIGSFQVRYAGAFHRWVATIALRRLQDSIKHYRAEKRGGARRAAGAMPRGMIESTVMLLDLLAEERHTPSASAARHEALTLLDAAFRELPEHYREALTLVYMEDQPVAAAAARLGRSERAVHGLCRRGLKLLREQVPALLPTMSGLMPRGSAP